ncbi:tetratricopeptide repeat protein [Cystobacter fuscus]
MATAEAPVPVQVEAPPAPAPAPADTPAAKARERFAEAVAAFDAGDYARAEEGFQEVLHRAPQSLNAQYNLGVIAERQGRLADAQAAYEKVRFLDAGHVPTLLNLGRLYRMQGKYAEAISLYEAGLKTPGRDTEPSLLNNLSVAYRLAGKLPQAEATARRVLSRHPDDAEAYKNLALVYYEQGRYRLAETVLVNARKLAEKDPGISNNLGMVYLKLEDRPRALAQFQKAVSLDERFAPGYVNLGALALARRDYAGAERAFSKAVELEPQSHEAWLSYAYALDGQKGRDAKKGLQAGEALREGARAARRLARGRVWRGLGLRGGSRRLGQGRGLPPALPGGGDHERAGQADDRREAPGHRRHAQERRPRSSGRGRGFVAHGGGR